MSLGFVINMAMHDPLFSLFSSVLRFSLSLSGRALAQQERGVQQR
eukprot:COSAG06_NODE_26155_length_620_cov_1.376200_1_plen_44_part_10